MALVVLAGGATNCYSTGDGSPPPLDQLYYPVGLQVSAGGTVLYAVNSDFDLQYNGGTLQSYDLGLIRRHTVKVIADPSSLEVPFIDKAKQIDNNCPGFSPSLTPLGETCAPPVESKFYVRDAAVIGAFATDLLLSPPPASLPKSDGDGDSAGSRGFDRLFSAVRGNASVTWVNVERDTPTSIAPLDPTTPYGPFQLRCGQDSDRRCDGAHQAGSNIDETGNTRHISMPGEPFGMAMSQDGRAIIVTHQNETKTSLFDTGLKRGDTNGDPERSPSPSLQFVLDQVPIGGVGVASIPHDPDAFTGTTAVFPRQAFLETSRALPEISLIRQYPDEFNGRVPNEVRPFLDREGSFSASVGPGGADSRGIVIDPTPRLACKAKVRKNPVDALKGRTQAQFDAEILACARKPARVFIANRSPASLLVGELGGATTAENNFNADRLQLTASIPLSTGPSKLYLAPVVEADGALALRVFAVCFDSATIFVYNPDTEQVENVIRTGLGPFAMAFDPFTLEDVAENKVVDSFNGIRRYRFGYLASFTNSFIQVIDLDNADRSPTFERVVFTLGQPTTPKGS